MEILKKYEDDFVKCILPLMAPRTEEEVREHIEELWDFFVCYGLDHIKAIYEDMDANGEVDMVFEE